MDGDVRIISRIYEHGVSNCAWWCRVSHNSSRSGNEAFGMNSKSEAEEGFLHSGTAKSAVPPVEMTRFGRWIASEKLASEKLGLHRIIV